MNDTAEKPASSVRSTSKNAAILGPVGPSRISRVSLSWSTLPRAPTVYGGVPGMGNPSAGRRIWCRTRGVETRGTEMRLLPLAVLFAAAAFLAALVGFDTYAQVIDANPCQQSCYEQKSICVE